MATTTTIFDKNWKPGTGGANYNFTFVDRSDEVKNAMEKGIHQALQAIGQQWIKNVTYQIRSGFGKPIIQTGALVNSMQFDVDIKNQVVYVGSSVEHSTYVELGTPKMPARPYLNTSILQYISDYEKAVKSVLGDGWKVSAGGYMHG